MQFLFLSHSVSLEEQTADTKNFRGELHESLWFIDEKGPNTAGFETATKGESQKSLRSVTPDGAE